MDGQINITVREGTYTRFSLYSPNHNNVPKSYFVLAEYSVNIRYIYHFVTGAMMKVPRPEPHTAIPVAKARLFSKYMDTLTIAGR